LFLIAEGGVKNKKTFLSCRVNDSYIYVCLYQPIEQPHPDGFLIYGFIVIILSGLILLVKGIA